MIEPKERIPWGTILAAITLILAFHLVAGGITK